MTCIKTKFATWFSVAALAAGMLIGCKEKPQPATAEPNNVSKQQSIEPQNSAEPNAAVKPATDPKPTLREIIAKRRGWKPVFTDWYGQDAPDFTLVDITGKKHTLSEYRGKNVMLTFWATWCGPCIKEIPHLIELRNELGEDKLTILAISYIGPMNSAEKIKRFVAANPVINYTVIPANMPDMPRPYNIIEGIPCTFYVDPEGKIKIVTEGLISLPQIRAILEAQR